MRAVGYFVFFLFCFVCVLDARLGSFVLFVIIFLGCCKGDVDSYVLCEISFDEFHS